MPPANCHQPKRAQSSTSEYTLTPFRREFPDDAACLEHLWRTRHFPDGEHAHCPRCGSERFFKRYATKQGRQSRTCTGCGQGMRGTYEKASRNRFQSYLAEYAWRYNQRRSGPMFHAMLDEAAK